MHLTTVAIDLAKNVFEVAGVDAHGQVVERRRLTRLQLERLLATRDIGRVVMKACGTAHYWGRWLAERGVAVALLPPHYVKAYVRRSKTDRADATALLEASRATDILPVPVKSMEQQALQGLHRVREAWRATRMQRINTLRGLCREFGVNAPLGAKRGLAILGARLADEDGAVPTMLRVMLQQLIEEIRSLEAWGVEVQARRGHNKAAVSVANKLARIIWATWRHERDFTPRILVA